MSASIFSAEWPESSPFPKICRIWKPVLSRAAPENTGSVCFFSAAMVLANYPLFAPMSLLAVFTFCLCFPGGFLVFWNIFLFLSRETFVQASPPASRPAPVFLIVFAAAALTDLLYLYTAAYPGVLTRDSVTTVQEILQGSYSSTMPFWHTMTVRVFLKTGMRLFGEINRAIAFFTRSRFCFFPAASPTQL